MATRTITRRVFVKARPRRRSKAGFTLPIAPLAGLMVGMIPAVKSLAEGKPEAAASGLIYHYTGWRTWDNKFSANGLKSGLMPLVIGGLVHKYVGGKLGVNRALAQAGIPIIRI